MSDVGMPFPDVDEARSLIASMFIHIPKTGGTSVEAVVSVENSLRWQFQACCDPTRHPPVEGCCWKKGAAPPWHLAPDVFERLYGRSIEAYAGQQHRRPRWCVVRNPAERFTSCVTWDRKVHNFAMRYRTEPAELAKELSKSRFDLPWNGIAGANDLHAEELAHRQPQSWFVWDEQGAVQCDCIVAIEKLDQIVAQRENSYPAQPMPLPSPLRELYRPDFELWERARDSAGLCYRPQPRLPSPPPTLPPAPIPNPVALSPAAQRPAPATPSTPPPPPYPSVPPTSPPPPPLLSPPSLALPSPTLPSSLWVAAEPRLVLASAAIGVMAVTLCITIVVVLQCCHRRAEPANPPAPRRRSKRRKSSYLPLACQGLDVAERDRSRRERASDRSHGATGRVGMSAHP